jgi:hypothetical protein
MLITLLVHTRAHRAAVLRKRCSCSSDVQRCCAFSARCCAFSTARCCAFSAARCCARCCAFSAARCCAFSAARCCAFSTGGEEQMHCRARGKHAAPGHRVDMSSRLPPYFTQIKSNIPLLTRLCRGPWSPPMLHPAYRHHFSAFLDRWLYVAKTFAKNASTIRILHISQRFGITNLGSGQVRRRALPKANFF